MDSEKLLTRVRLRAEQRREQILDEAVRMIGQRGYYGFSISELAQRCQLTNAGLLHHFGSKDELLIALLQDRDRRDAAAVTSVIGLAHHAEPAELTLKTVLSLFRAIVARNSTQAELVRLYALLHAEALDEQHPAYDYFLSREAATLKAFAKVVAPYVEDPFATARQVLALMAGLELQWLRADQAFDLAAEWDRAAAMLLPPQGRRSAKPVRRRSRELHKASR